MSWQQYVPFRGAFAEMLDERKWPLEWLDQKIASGEATAFASDTACIVTALRQYPGGAVEIHGLCAAGELDEIVRLIGIAEQWGRENGATLATIASRRGWMRALKDHGYEETQVVIEKEMTWA